jgi:hypothetical protein
VLQAVKISVASDYGRIKIIKDIFSFESSDRLYLSGAQASDPSTFVARSLIMFRTSVFNETFQITPKPTSGDIPGMVVSVRPA